MSNKPLPPDTIHTARAAVIAITRTVGITLLAVGLYLMLKRLVFALGSGAGMSMFTSWTGVGEEHSFYRGIAMTIVGTPLVICARRLAHSIITVPADGCPRCDYERQPEADRCPECGYRYA